MPLLLEFVHPHNVICIDSTTSFINESVPEKVWMTEEKKSNMKRRRAGAKAETNNGQRRAFNLNPKPKTYSLIEPSTAPEQAAVVASGNPVVAAVHEQAAVAAGLLEGTDIAGASERTQAAAAPHAASAAFESVFADTPFAAMLRYAKLPPAQTSDCQVNDMATLHPLLHAGFASLEFYSLTEAGMQKTVEEYPGLAAPLKFLDESSMSGKSKETYKKAIVYLVKLIQRALTPAIVDDAMKTAGFYPLDSARIMYNMWEHFEYLSPTEADEAIRIAEGPCRDIFRRDGMIFPDATVAAVEASEVCRSK
jgi:hypothetical protein